MDDFENNTNLFYEELNKNPCDINYLLNLSKKGIYLKEPLFNYENIKYHEYAIDISLMNDQFFIIYNDSQYNKFMNYLKNGDLRKVIYPSNWFYSYDLLIINKFFMDKLLAETDEDILTKYTKCIKLNILLYYIFKYSKINSINLFQFGYLDLHYKDVLYVLFREYFYLNEKHDIDKVTNYVNENTFISYIYGLFGRDINVINFILNKYENINRICENFLRVPLNLPFNLQKEYSKKLFKPNTLHFTNDNKEFEDFVNLVFSDIGLYEIPLPVFDKKNYFNKYNIDISYIKKENILNYTNFKPTYSPSCRSIDFFFNNLDLFKYNFNINHEPSTIIDLNSYKRDESYNSEDESYNSEDESYYSEESYNNEEPYNYEEEQYKKDPINYIINYEYDIDDYTYDNLIDKHSCILFYAFFLSTSEKIDKWLEDPNYILNIEIKNSGPFNFNYFKKVCYIASLIHNKTPDFIIFALLRFFSPNHIIYKNKKLHYSGFSQYSPDIYDDNYCCIPRFYMYLRHAPNEKLKNIID